MVNFQISSNCSSTAATPVTRTTSSWATTLIAANSPSNASLCYSHTRSSTPKTSSCYGATTSAQVSTGFTDSTMSVIYDIKVGKRKYNLKLWKLFSDVFNVMPVCALVDEKIMCMHGGLSPQLENLEQILKIVRPVEVPDQGLLCDLLWADP